MEQWLRIGQPQIQEILKHDPEFKQLLAKMKEAELEYRRVMDTLPPQDQEIIENYIVLCENVEYQKTYTAYRCGRMHR